jgi:hypothetical protein
MPGVRAHVRAHTPEGRLNNTNKAYHAGECRSCLPVLSLGVRGATGKGFGFCRVERALELMASVELGVVPFFEKSRLRFVVADGGSTGVSGTTR